MADFDRMVLDAIRYSLSIDVKCTLDDDGDGRVTVKLLLDGREICSAEDYFDSTGAKAP